MSKAKSKNPAYPDAHPTAPGGMSEKALVKELVEEHGWDVADAKSYSWPQKIEAVIEHRRLAEGDASPSIPDADDDLLAELDDLLDEPVEAVSADEVALPEGAPLFIGMPTTKDYIFDGHMGASPSGAERWMTCTASLGATRAFLETLTPNQQVALASGGIAARQGTTAHAAAEAEALVIIGKSTAEEAEATLLELAIEPETDGEAYDDTMAEYIAEYVDLVRAYTDDRGDDHVMIEQTVEAVVELMTVDADGEPHLHSIRGSADLIVLPSPDEMELVVGDLKYGEGIDVDVEQNPQIRIYALGALDLLTDDEGNLRFTPETITYHIIQPRLGGIKTWSESLDDLLDWRDEVLSPALTEALGGLKAGAKFQPSEVACQWCPVRGSCPALAESRVAAAAELFDVITETEYAEGPGVFPETSTLSSERLGALYSQIKGLLDIVGDLKEEAQRRLHRGEEVPGFHLVSYTPPRKWIEQAQDEIAAGLDGLTRKERDALFKAPALVTPTAAIKLLGDKKAALLDDLIDVPDKRPVIAPVGDRRKAWTGRPPEQMFPDLDEED